MNRRQRKLGVALVLSMLIAGGVINLVVAWWGAVHRGNVSMPRIWGEVDPPDWPFPVPSEWTPPVEVRFTRGLGFDTEFWENYSSSVAWSYSLEPRPMPTDAPRTVQINRYGFPLRCMTCIEVNDNWVVLAEHSHPGVAMPGVAKLLGGYPATLFPTRVVVLTYGLNTLFYAGLLGVPFVPAMVRRWRRARRGLCLACGYEIRDLSPCPECGAVRPTGAL